MSWQAYVDTNLVGTGKVSKAAILGQQGGIWASTSGYSLDKEQQDAILVAHNNVKATLENGIVLNGRKFFILRADERSIYGRKEGDGCIIVKTKQAILVTEYLAPIQAPEATPVVEGLADYLITAGY